MEQVVKGLHRFTDRPFRKGPLVTDGWMCGVSRTLALHSDPRWMMPCSRESESLRCAAS
jgi:hypothetical protein